MTFLDNELGGSVPQSYHQRSGEERRAADKERRADEPAGIVRSDPENHAGRLAVLVLGIIAPFLVLILYRAGGYLTDPVAHLANLRWLALVDAGFVPYRDFWIERPPALVPVLVALHRAALLLPPWIDSRLWQGIALGLPAAIGAAASVPVMIRLAGPARTALLVAALPILVVSSQATAALPFWLAALLLVRSDRQGRAILVAAVASLFGSPFLLLAIVLVVIGRSSRPSLPIFVGVAVLSSAIAILTSGLPGTFGWVARPGGLFEVATEQRLDVAALPASLSRLIVIIVVATAAVLFARLQRIPLLSCAGIALVFPAFLDRSGLDLLALVLPLPLVVLPLIGGFVAVALVGVALTVATVSLEPSTADLALTIGAVIATASLFYARDFEPNDWFEPAVQVGAFILTRLGALIALRPFGYFGEWNDFDFFLRWARLADSGLLPYRDFWMEHPPVFPSFVTLAYAISAQLPPPPDPHSWFNLALGLIMLPIEVAGFLALRSLAARAGVANPLVVGWMLVLSVPAIFFFTAGFDGLPLAFLALGLLAASRNHASRAGFWIALGTMTKILPIAALAALVIGFGRRGVRTLAIFLATVVVIATPVAIVNGPLAAASVQSVFSRGSWETVWALADGYYRGGELVPPAERTDPATVARTIRPSAVPWPPIAAVAGLGYIALVMRTRRPIEPRRLVALASAGLIGLLLISKGWSPQFVVYPIAIAAVLLPTRRALIYIVNLIAANTFEYPVSLLLLDTLPEPLTIAIVWRSLILGCVVAELLAIGLEWRLSMPRQLRWPLVALPVAFLPLVAWGLITYRTLWLEPDDPYRPIIVAAQRSEARLVAIDDTAFAELAAYLPDRVRRPAAGRIAIQSGEWWLVDGGDAEVRAAIEPLLGTPIEGGPAGVRRFRAR